jgi:tetrathionate reductase subunit A
VGQAAAVDIHRGPAQHTNGFYAVLAWMSVNMLLGNFDHKGGMIAAATYDIMGKGKGCSTWTPTPAPSSPSASAPSATARLREDHAVRRLSRPAQLVPAGRATCTRRVIPSIGDAYPYPVKACSSTWPPRPTRCPPATRTSRSLRDVEKLPLFISNDILVGTTSMYADYIFPDLSFLERWEFQGSRIPTCPQGAAGAPAGHGADSRGLHGLRRSACPLSFEAMMLGIAEYLKLPGFGADGLGEGLASSIPDDSTCAHGRNLAFGGKARRLATGARRRRPRDGPLPEGPAASAPSRLRSGPLAAIVGDDVAQGRLSVLNRGGRFQTTPRLPGRHGDQRLRGAAEPLPGEDRRRRSTPAPASATPGYADRCAHPRLRRQRAGRAAAGPRSGPDHPPHDQPVQEPHDHQSVAHAADAGERHPDHPSDADAARPARRADP